MFNQRVASASMLAACVLAAVLSGCAGSGPAVKAPAAPAAKEAAPAFNPKEVVAWVNGKEITRLELERSKKILIAGQPGMQVPPYLLKEFEKQALDQLISNELLYQAGEKLEVKDLDKNADAKLTQLKSGFKDPETYAKELEGIGMTEPMLREYSRRDLVIANFVNSKIIADLKVSDEEIKKFYGENPDKFVQQEQVRTSHVLIGCDAKASAEEKKKARDKAEKLQKELASGADFAKVAQENSSCPSAKNGGDLGYFGKGKMVPPFEQAAFALKSGEISPVVETSFGYHVIKQTDRIKGDKVSLDAAKEKIGAYIKAQKANLAVSSYVGQAKQDAKIEVLLK